MSAVNLLKGFSMYSKIHWNLQESTTLPYHCLLEDCSGLASFELYVVVAPGVWLKSCCIANSGAAGIVILSSLQSKTNRQKRPQPPLPCTYICEDE